MAKKLNSYFLEDFIFTQREWEVLSCFSVGIFTSKDIAKYLEISPKTVETHLSHILFKIPCPSRNRLPFFIKQIDSDNELDLYFQEKFGDEIKKMCLYQPSDEDEPKNKLLFFYSMYLLFIFFINLFYYFYKNIDFISI